MKVTTIIAFVLVLIGALVWFIVGLFDFNVLSYIFMGGLAFIPRIIYALVGISAIWLLFYWIVYNPFKRIN